MLIPFFTTCFVSFVPFCGYDFLRQKTQEKTLTFRLFGIILCVDCLVRMFKAEQGCCSCVDIVSVCVSSTREVFLIFTMSRPNIPCQAFFVPIANPTQWGHHDFWSISSKLTRLEHFVFYPTSYHKTFPLTLFISPESFPHFGGETYTLRIKRHYEADDYS